MADRDIDIVMCIDKTRSMAPLIDEIKRNAFVFPEFVARSLETEGQHLGQLRVKVIAFGDYAIDEKPMEESEFFTLVGETNDEDKFEAFLKEHVVANGGGDIPENSLEAIAKALMSDWYKGQNKCRHIILLFTDAEALPLGERAGYGDYDDQWYPEDLDEFVAWFEGKNTDLKFDKYGGRLVLFAPDVYPWNYISGIVERVFTVYSKAGTGLSGVNIYDIISSLIRAI